MENLCEPSQLNEASFTFILQNFFNDNSVKVIQVKKEEKSGAVNDSYNSDIDRWTIRFNQNGEPEQETKVIIKSSRGTAFHRRSSSISRPFAKEIFWFNVAYPELSKKFPELENISPVCYYAYSNYLDSFMGSKMVLERNCGMICWPLVLPEEKGLLALKDLKHGDRPMKMLEKTSIFTYKQAKVVMEALARFHGIWLKYLHLAAQDENYSQVLKQEHLKGLEMKFKPWMIKGLMKNQTEQVTGLLKNENVSEKIVKKWETYGKTRMTQKLIDGGDVTIEKSRSKIVTVCHGDLWCNNMLFDEAEDHVTFIDFQMLSFSHPARDIWYFLSVSSDLEFRKNHLDKLLLDYFEIFRTYLDGSDVRMTFEEFKAEVFERRDYFLSLGLQIMPNVLSPNQLDFDGWRAFSNMNKKRMAEIAGTPKPDDHPMILEIRRRIIQIILEAEEAGTI